MAGGLVRPQVLDVAVRVKTLQGNGQDQMVTVERISDGHAAERQLKRVGNGLGGLGKRDAGRGRQALGVGVARSGGDEEEPFSPGAAGAAGAVTRQTQRRDQVDLVDLGHGQVQAAVGWRDRRPLGPQERQHLARRQAEDFLEDAGQRERQGDGDPHQQHGSGGERGAVASPQTRVAVHHRPLYARRSGSTAAPRGPAHTPALPRHMAGEGEARARPFGPTMNPGRHDHAGVLLCAPVAGDAWDETGQHH